MAVIRMILKVPDLTPEELLEAAGYVDADPYRTEPLDAMDVLMQIANADLQVNYVVIESKFLED